MKSALMALTLALLVSVSAGAAGPDHKEVESDGYKMDVTLDRGTGKAYVDVKKSKSKADLPGREMMLTLFDDRGTGQAVRLKAMDPSSAFPRYMGEVAHSPESFVGVEIRFETSLKALKVLRSMPKIPDTAPGK